MTTSGPVLEPNNSLRDVLSVTGAFTPAEVAAVLQLVPPDPPTAGTVSEHASARATRRSRIQWIKPDPPAQWLYGKMNRLFHEVNRQYRFEISGFGDLLQVARYGEGDHYDWHMDIGKGKSSTRKISISVLLSDPADYEGGDLEFFGMPDAAFPREVGTAISFPTFLPHRVRPVTRGVRLSLVTWIAGPPFR